MKNLTITEARSRMPALAAEIERDPSTVVGVTRRGKPIMAMISADFYEALVETLEILGDAPTVSKLRQAMREVAEGKAIPWNTAKKRLGLEP